MPQIIYKQGGSTISKRFIQRVRGKISFFIDNRILFGIGIGLILGVICMWGYKSTIGLSDSQIEERARDMGMIYESEQKAIFSGEGE